MAIITIHFLGRGWGNNMALAPIAGTQTGMEAFLDQLQKGQEENYRKALTEQAYGNAAQSKMLSNLLGTAFGMDAGLPSNMGAQSSPYNQPGQAYPADSSNASPGMNKNPSDKMLAARKMLERIGFLQPTIEEKAASERENAYQKELAANDVKKISALEDVAQSGIEAEPSYQAAAQVISNPEWAKMRDFPLAPGAQLEYYKRAGSPEQRKMIGDFEVNANQFIVNSIKKFPQRFTNQDMSFMKSMKMSPNDSLEAAQAKLSGAWAYDQIMSQRAALAAKIAREQRIPVHEALKIANKQLNIDEMRKNIQEQVTGKKYENKATPSTKDNMTTNNKPPAGTEVEIYNPQGQLIGYASKVNAAKFLEHHRGHYQKVISHGQK